MKPELICNLRAVTFLWLICVGCVPARAPLVVLGTFCKQRMIWDLSLSPLGTEGGDLSTFVSPGWLFATAAQDPAHDRALGHSALICHQLCLMPL